MEVLIRTLTDKITGNVNYEQSICQNVNVKTRRNIRETYTLSGWAKGPSLPKKEREQGIVSNFMQIFRLVLMNGSMHQYSSQRLSTAR